MNHSFTKSHELRQAYYASAWLNRVHSGSSLNGTSSETNYITFETTEVIENAVAFAPTNRGIFLIEKNLR